MAVKVILSRECYTFFLPEMETSPSVFSLYADCDNYTLVRTSEACVQSLCSQCGMSD